MHFYCLLNSVTFRMCSPVTNDYTAVLLFILRIACNVWFAKQGACSTNVAVKRWNLWKVVRDTRFSVFDFTAWTNAIEFRVSQEQWKLPFLYVLGYSMPFYQFISQFLIQLMFRAMDTVMNIKPQLSVKQGKHSADEKLDETKEKWMSTEKNWSAITKNVDE